MLRVGWLLTPQAKSPQPLHRNQKLFATANAGVVRCSEYDTDLATSPSQNRLVERSPQRTRRHIPEPSPSRRRRRHHPFGPTSATGNQRLPPTHPDRRPARHHQIEGLRGRHLRSRRNAPDLPEIRELAQAVHAHLAEDRLRIIAEAIEAARWPDAH